jgi:trehalose/maltose transport system substrate-binding protein
MHFVQTLLAFATILLLTAGPVVAANLSIAVGDTGTELGALRGQLKVFEERTGHSVNIVAMPSSSSEQFAQYKLWLAAQNTDIDVYRIDIIWAPQLASQLLDLTEATADVIDQHFPSIVESQTVEGKLVALPLFTDAPALYYRKDLLEKYDAPVPQTWDEMAATAKMVMDKEREAGNSDMWGFVFQGKAYEGLTCDALEWVKSSGGGQIVEADGTISVNNPEAAAAIERARGWVGTISPPGVLAYGEEESRGVWQTGNAVFMRNWPYAYALGNAGDSAIKGKFDVTTLPIGKEGDRSTATLGGWNLAIPKFVKDPKASVELVKFLASPEQQKVRALVAGNLPTNKSLYRDGEIAEKLPIIPRWEAVFHNAVARPSATTKLKYNEVSNNFWSAVHKTLSGEGTVADNLAALEIQLTRLKGAAW